MTYTILRKEQNIAGDWSVLIQHNDDTLSFLFNSDPTQAMIDGRVQDLIDNPPEEETTEEETTDDTTE